MNMYETKYFDLLRDIITNGNRKADRTGTGTYSVFGRTLTHNLDDGFPMLTCRKQFLKSAIYELLWFLQGGNNIEYLCKNGVSIWNEWPHKAYMQSKERSSSEPDMDAKEFGKRIADDHEFAMKWGGLGAVYGYQWKNWLSRDGKAINQIDGVIDLLRKDPDSRRIMVTAWNPEDIPGAKLPPCHYLWQVNSRVLNIFERIKLYESTNSNVTLGISPIEAQDALDCLIVNKRLHSLLDDKGVPSRELNMIFNMRSVDMILGFPTDFTSYSMLTMMIASVVNMKPGNVTAMLGDTHIYINHIQNMMPMLELPWYELPKMKLTDRDSIYDFQYSDFELSNYTCGEPIKFPIAI